MIPFEYQRAGDAAGAVAAVAGRPGAMFLAGGTNLVARQVADLASSGVSSSASAVWPAVPARAAVR